METPPRGMRSVFIIWKGSKIDFHTPPGPLPSSSLTLLYLLGQSDNIVGVPFVKVPIFSLLRSVGCDTGEPEYKGIKEGNIF